jgi:small conductance mechanosensitive channel
VFANAQRRTTTDVAGTLRIITRLLGYGLIFSFLVSVLTDNPAAALTMGSFAGLVAGFASQTVMGHLVAGIFLALFRPIGIGDNVTIGRNSGTVSDITLMHVVLETDEEQSLIPSSTVVSTVLVKHKSSD